MFFLRSQMHPLTQVFVGLELMMFAVQLYRCFSRPNDRPRLWYLILLGLLIFYNVTGGLFPDPEINVLSVQWQNTIAYGSGFLMAAYFPFYFYRSFNLKALRFQAIYGVSLFLLLPYLVFFVLIYGINKDLKFAVSYGLIVPFLYSLYLLWALLQAVRWKFRAKQGSAYPAGTLEMLGTYCAVFPWVCLSVFAYFNISQWIEVLVTNMGFLLITVMYLKRSAAMERIEHDRLGRLLNERNLSFEEKCREFGLSSRETEIALLSCRGLTYETTGSTLNISKKTVDRHMQNIFIKTGAKNKIELIQLLGLV